ncbi:High-affinity branched-chain amino acid transport ATP-binding protein LivF [compost metagenome]
MEQNANLALKVSARAYVIEMGEFVLAGNAAAVRADPRILSSYLGGRELYAA